MSGYEKLPDYGGPPPTWRSYVFIGIALAMGAAAFAGVARALFRLVFRWLFT